MRETHTHSHDTAPSKVELGMSVGVIIRSERVTERFPDEGEVVFVDNDVVAALHGLCRV